jgi:hypothetical protein
MDECNSFILVSLKSTYPKHNHQESSSLNLGPLKIRDFFFKKEFTRSEIHSCRVLEILSRKEEKN